MTALRAIQAGLEISDPTAMEIKKVWAFRPPADKSLADLPCWLNSWTFTGEERQFAHERLQRYTVSMQLFVGSADVEADIKADIASAFMAELVDALDASIALGGAVTYQNLRGGDPTLALLDWAGLGYVGLNLFLDLEMKEGASFAR